MSQYYSITESTDEEVIGIHYPQCAGLLTGYNNEYENQQSLYYFAHQKGKKIDYTPDLSSIKILERTKMTDLISCGLGPGNDLVVSSRFKDIIEKSSSSQYQIFETILNKKKNKFQYWWIHYIYNLEKVVDYEASTFFHVNKQLRDKVKKIKSYKEYRQFYDKEDTYGFIRAINTVLKHKSLDFFIVGQFNQTHYASEKLKDKLVTAGITGLDFKIATDIEFR
jgi:hypothetical protein